MTKRLMLPTLSPERRRDLLRLPGLSYWAKLALQREHVEIDCRLDDSDLAIQRKLNPDLPAWRYHADRPAGQRIERFENFKPGQALKKRATLALEGQIKPWRNRPRPRTGGTRGRPSLAPVLAALDACDLRSDEGEQRLRSVVLAHLKPANRSEKWAIIRALDATVERQGGRVDWREWLRNMRTTLHKTADRNNCRHERS